MNNIELNSLEQNIIENALNAYWNDAHIQLDNNCKYSLDGTKLSLGDLEKEQLQLRKELTHPLIERFKNL